MASSFKQGKDLSIREVAAPELGRSSQEGAQPAADTALIGKIDEMLRSMSALGSRVDALARDVAVMRGDADEPMLEDETRNSGDGRPSRSPSGRAPKRIHIR